MLQNLEVRAEKEYETTSTQKLGAEIGISCLVRSLSVLLSVFHNRFLALFFISGLNINMTWTYLEKLILQYNFLLLLQFLSNFKSLL